MTHWGRVARRLVVHGCFHRTPSAVRRREGCSAEGHTSETRDHDLLNRLVHITPLSTFFFVVAAKLFSALQETRRFHRRFLTNFSSVCERLADCGSFRSRLFPPLSTSTSSLYLLSPYSLLKTSYSREGELLQSGTLPSAVGVRVLRRGGQSSRLPVISLSRRICRGHAGLKLWRQAQKPDVAKGRCGAVNI